MCAFFSRALPLVVSLLIVSVPVMAQPTYYNLESGQVRPLAISPDDPFLFAVNTPDNRLEVLDLNTLAKLSSVQMATQISRRCRQSGSIERRVAARAAPAGSMTAGLVHMIPVIRGHAGTVIPSACWEQPKQ